MSKDAIKLIAFYLPQFHPIPENDAAWGEGFTEWTNVVRATPFFSEHWQPQLPSELGFYDLRDPSILTRQATLASEYGIFGFCYYFYWFDGRRVLERPIEEMLVSGEPRFPFCLCWANESWSRRWDGSEEDVIIPQHYAKSSEIIYDLLKYFQDKRYITIDGKPLILVYRPNAIPNVDEIIANWRKVAQLNGLDLYIVGCLTFGFRGSNCFDAFVEFPPHNVRCPTINESIDWSKPFYGRVVDYEATIIADLLRERSTTAVFQTAMVAWDNTPRRGDKGTIFLNSTPEAAQIWISELVRRSRENGTRFVFLNAWNEWAEGAHIEPDQKYGRRWLEICKDSLVSVTRFHLRAEFASNPYVRHEWSRHFLGLGKLTDALSEIRKAIELSPNVAHFHALEASILAEMRSFAEAAAACARAAALNPSDGELHCWLGNLFAEQEDWHSAIVAYRNALANSPGHLEALLQITNALLQVRDAEGALKIAQEALALAPNSAVVRYALGNALCGCERWDEAAEEHRLALTLQPDFPGARGQLSNVLAKISDRNAHSGKRDAAIEAAQEAIELEPEAGALHHHLGQLFVLAERWQEAAQSLKRALELKVPAPDIEANLSNALAKSSLQLARSGEVNAAIVAARQAIELEPSNAPLHHHLGQLLIKAQRWQEALDVLRQLDNLQPNDPETMAQLSNVLAKRSDQYSRKGDIAAAIMAARQAIELTPQNSNLHQYLGQLLITSGRWQEAIDWFRRIREIGPDVQEATFQLSYALAKWSDQLARDGKTYAAIDVASEAIELRPADAALQYHLGQLLVRAERWHQAVEVLKRVRKFGAYPPEADTQLSSVLTKLSGQLAQSGRIDAAIDAAREAVEFAPDEAVLHRHLGHLFMLARRWRDAAQSLQQAKNLNANLPGTDAELSDALAKLSNELGQSGNIQAAIEAAGSAIDLQPGMAALHLHIGQLLIMAERWKEAVEALRQARRLGADLAGFHSQLSKALAKTSDQLARDGKIDAAIDAIREAIQLAPEDASLHHHLGHLYALCDRWHDATVAQRQVLKFDESHILAMVHLSEGLVRTGEIKEAISLARRALQLSPQSIWLQEHLRRLLTYAADHQQNENDPLPQKGAR